MNNTSKIWEKHFGNVAGVGLDNPNFESFMDELTQDCLNETHNKRTTPQWLKKAAIGETRPPQPTNPD